jgi:hypothetical protein
MPWKNISYWKYWKYWKWKFKSLRFIENGFDKHFKYQNKRKLYDHW